MCKIIWLGLWCMLGVTICQAAPPPTNQKEEQTITAEKVVVKAKRVKYKKRGNPAVELAKKLHEQRRIGDPIQNTNLIYIRSEKLVISINNAEPIDSTHKLAAINQSIVQDSATGKQLLPILLKEKIIQTTSRAGKKTEHVLALNSYGMDEKMDQESISNYFSMVMEPVDVFDDYISFVQRRFLGPLAAGATDFFRFHLDPDTIQMRGHRVVRLSFYPINKMGSGINGSLFVRVDSTLFIERAEISMPYTANVNFVYNLNLAVDYTRDADGYRFIEREELRCNFGMSQELAVLHANRVNTFTGYEVLARHEPIPVAAVAAAVPSQLSDEEISKVTNFNRTMRKHSVFQIWEEAMVFLLDQGYFRTGKNSKFDIGPVFNFLSNNTLEGMRLGIGGTTTPALFNQLFFEGYAAYGFGDQRWKYSAAVEYSFNKTKKHVREYPVHSLRFSWTDDVHQFGSPFETSAGNSVFSSVQRDEDSLLTYMQRAELLYTKEFKSNFSLNVGLRHWQDHSSAVWQFAPTVDRYRMTELMVHARYAPGEVIFQDKIMRYNLQKYIPIIEFSHTTARKGVLWSDYTSNRTTFKFSSRVNVQPLGYLDVRVRGDYQWNAVPYMLLPHPSSNLSYFMWPESFSFMRPLEFLYDRALTWDVEYFMDGLILSRIPGVNQLKLREVFSFRGVWGCLSDRNNPRFNPSLLSLPVQSSAIGSTPYMEISAGIENILGVFRVDYGWRLSYLDSSSVVKGGVMINLLLKF